MLRELIDRAILEDFLSGLGRAVGLRLCAYDMSGRLIAASPPVSPFARASGRVLAELPRQMELIPLPADEPPASVAFVEDRGVWYVVAPAYAHDKLAGYISAGEFRGQAGDASPQSTDRPAPELHNAWEQLPVLLRRADAQGVLVARWTARMLGMWCRREARVRSDADELSLIGDIGELLSGESDLQTILDHVVAETARVMRCAYCSLRLYDPVTDELAIKAGHNLPEAYLRKGMILRSQNPIDDEALNGRLVYIEDAASDPRFRFREQARRHGIVSGLTAGMTYRGKPIGVLRVYTDRRQSFRNSQRRLLQAVASQAAIAIVNAQLVEERLRAAQTERQMALAGDVQRRMIRTPAPTHPHVQTALVFDPSSHVSGDFCDFLTLCDGRLAAVVGDVVGHGVAASLLMASVRGALRATAECCADLGEILTRLNRHVFRETSPAEFVTLLVVAVDDAGRRLSYCSAGHEPLLLLRAGRVRPAEDAGLVLGVAPDERYPEGALDLHPGDFALLYTDGTSEAMNFDGEHFGRARLHQSLINYGTAAPDQALRNIRWDIRRFVGLADQSDDLTMVGLRVRW